MRRFSVTIVLSLLILWTLQAQVSEEYNSHVNRAFKLYKNQDYRASADAYRAAFASNAGKATPTDRYNAACSYGLANQADSAFYHLFYLAENPKIKYNNLSHLSTDTDLNSLHNTKRWSELLAMVAKNKKEFEKDFDHELVAILDSVYATDQDYRRQVVEVMKEKGNESAEAKALWKTILRYDSINEITVSKILDERGWLGADVIGGKGNMTLFLVIQHANIEVQEKYLPMMRQAVKEGKAQGSSLALLEDRVALRQGKKQIYGSQIHTDKETGKQFVALLLDPDNVDARRAEVGLGTMAEYAAYFDMEWDLEKFKQEQHQRETKAEANHSK